MEQTPLEELSDQLCLIYRTNPNQRIELVKKLIKDQPKLRMVILMIQLINNDKSLNQPRINISHLKTIYFGLYKEELPAVTHQEFTKHQNRMIKNVSKNVVYMLNHNIPIVGEVSTKDDIDENNQIVPSNVESDEEKKVSNTQFVYEEIKNEATIEELSREVAHVLSVPVENQEWALIDLMKQYSSQHEDIFKILGLHLSKEDKILYNSTYNPLLNHEDSTPQKDKEKPINVFNEFVQNISNLESLGIGEFISELTNLLESSANTSKKGLNYKLAIIGFSLNNTKSVHLKKYFISYYYKLTGVKIRKISRLTLLQYSNSQEHFALALKLIGFLDKFQSINIPQTVHNSDNNLNCMVKEENVANNTRTKQHLQYTNIVNEEKTSNSSQVHLTESSIKKATSIVFKKTTSNKVSNKSILSLELLDDENQLIKVESVRIISRHYLDFLKFERKLANSELDEIEIFEEQLEFITRIFPDLTLDQLLDWTTLEQVQDTIKYIKENLRK